MAGGSVGGQVLASGSEDGTARVWLRPLDLPPPGDGGDGGGGGGGGGGRPPGLVLRHQGIVTGVERCAGARVRAHVRVCLFV